MGRLSDLRADLLTMTPEQQLARIREIRAERKINRNPVKEKKAKQAKRVDIGKLAKSLEGLTPEQLKELLG